MTTSPEQHSPAPIVVPRFFSKQFGVSLLRSTWDLGAPGVEAVGQERNLFIALLRRFWQFIPTSGTSGCRSSSTSTSSTPARAAHRAVFVTRGWRG